MASPRGVIPVELGLEVAAEHVEARADVALELARAEDLGDGACGLAPPDLELKEPVARRGVALCEEQVVLALGVDVVDAPAVADELDGLTEARGLQRIDGRARGWRGGRGLGACRHSEERDQEGDPDGSNSQCGHEGSLRTFGCAEYSTIHSNNEDSRKHGRSWGLEVLGAWGVGSGATVAQRGSANASSVAASPRPVATTTT